MRREDYPLRDDKFYDRLATYENFPESCPVSAENLAKAGFRYTGVNDMVLCDYCQGRLQRWEETDDPIVEHARYVLKLQYQNIIIFRHYQNCEFLLPLTQAPHNPEVIQNSKTFFCLGIHPNYRINSIFIVFERRSPGQFVR